MKKMLFTMILIFVSTVSCHAEKIPFKITPIQVVSTEHDETEVGDWITFRNVQDVYVEDKLFLKKDTDIVGIVDFVDPNGWGSDDAEITIKTFKTVDLNNKKVEIDATLNIKKTGDEFANVGELVSYYVLRIIRGSEIFIEPDTKIFNIFLTQ